MHCEQYADMHQSIDTEVLLRFLVEAVGTVVVVEMTIERFQFVGKSSAPPVRRVSPKESSSQKSQTPQSKSSKPSLCRTKWHNRSPRESNRVGISNIDVRDWPS